MLTPQKGDVVVTPDGERIVLSTLLRGYWLNEGCDISISAELVDAALRSENGWRIERAGMLVTDGDFTDKVARACVACGTPTVEILKDRMAPGGEAAFCAECRGRMAIYLSPVTVGGPNGRAELVEAVRDCGFRTNPEPIELGEGFVSMQWDSGVVSTGDPSGPLPGWEAAEPDSYHDWQRNLPDGRQVRVYSDGSWGVVVVQSGGYLNILEVGDVMPTLRAAMLAADGAAGLRGERTVDPVASEIVGMPVAIDPNPPPHAWYIDATGQQRPVPEGASAPPRVDGTEWPRPERPPFREGYRAFMARRERAEAARGVPICGPFSGAMDDCNAFSHAPDLDGPPRNLSATKPPDPLFVMRAVDPASCSTCGGITWRRDRLCDGCGK